MRSEGVDEIMTTKSEPAKSENGGSGQGASGDRASGHGEDRPDRGSNVVDDTRRQLIGLAYRLLGSLADAEDVVQEAYERWYEMSPKEQDAIRSPAAWLTTVTSRLCLNVLSSARVRHESYVGEWIPEPVPGSTQWLTGRSGGASVDPADRVTLDESINMAFLVVLESLTPAERVAFILHDVFCYSFGEVGEIVGRSPGACRQLASSARKRIRDSRTPSAPTAQQASLVRDFKVAWEAGDIDALVGLLDPDVTATSDGGGRVNTVLHPIEGIDQIVRSFVKLKDVFRDLIISERTVNGQPGLIAQRDGVTVSVYAFEVEGDRIKRIWTIRNPEKLKPWM
ncbi:RNA polymerase sigma factor SigJ [Humibacter sp. RRB41]|uniref:RNA polymerase sigma factor SigJ n=1 Tax=Humibacter sp. RRB41 TaxID=2919946 RepID=UPI001FAA9C7A|nr:RNA polymerase sigma factor SigJ [Humibacter sp. RRB41]